MTEIYKHVRTTVGDSEWGDLPRTLGTLISAGDSCVAVIEGELKHGVSGSGKNWQRWSNTSKTFFSTRTGVLRVYQKSRRGAERLVNGRVTYRTDFRDVTASGRIPRAHMTPGATGFFWESLDSILPTPSDPTLRFLERVEAAAFPLLAEAGWRPLQGIGAPLRATNLAQMAGLALGKSRVRKDVLRTLGGSRTLAGLQFAMSVKSLAPVDWLVPALAASPNLVMSPYDMRSARGSFARLRENQRRLLLIDLANLPNAYVMRDILMGFNDIPNGVEIPRATTWRELHNEIFPLAARHRSSSSGPIPQEGPSAKLDGLTVGDLVLSSAKDTQELGEWGAQMSHCIGGYGNEALKGRSHLFALHRGRNLLANLEVSPDGRVRQFYGRFNAVPPETITAPVLTAIATRMKQRLRAPDATGRLAG